METWEAKSLIHRSTEAVLTGVIVSNDSQLLEVVMVNYGWSVHILQITIIDPNRNLANI